MVMHSLNKLYVQPPQTMHFVSIDQSFNYPQNPSSNQSPTLNTKENYFMSCDSNYNESGITNTEISQDAKRQKPNEVQFDCEEEIDGNIKAELHNMSSPRSGESIESLDYWEKQQPVSYPKFPEGYRKYMPVAPDLSLFEKIPSHLPRTTPVSILGFWYHGQIVWWNRFLANRKRAQGTDIGNFVGRVVDLDTEWFPRVPDLEETKIKLKGMAAAMGRRSIIVQGFDEMRYLSLPPRAISSFPDPNPTRHGELITGLTRTGSLAARKGLLLALKIEELRRDTGELNGLLEIEFLDLCMLQQEQANPITEADLAHLEQLSVWDILKHKTFDINKPGLAKIPYHENEGIPMNPIISHNSNVNDLTSNEMADQFKIRETESHVRMNEVVNRDMMSDLEENQRAVEDERTNIHRDTNDPALKVSEDSIEQCTQLIKNLCLKRSEVLFLLRGIPLTLIASSTGLALPLDIPISTLKSLEDLYASQKFKVSKEQPDLPLNACRLMSLHFNISNAFLHRLFRTIAIRVSFRSIKSTQETPILYNQTTAIDSQCEDKYYSKSLQRILFCMDHMHQDPDRFQNPGFKRAQPLDWLYNMPKPFKCVDYMFAASSARQQITNKNVEGKSDSVIVHFNAVKCTKPSLRLLACGPISKIDSTSYYSIKLSEILNSEPTIDEIKFSAQSIMRSVIPDINLRELEKRVEELNLLREVAAYLNSIYSDLSQRLQETEGVISAEDGRFFESLWLDLQKKIK